MTMAEPRKGLVSVITPVFNGEPYLRACIESVLAQSYDNFEYIIADNCSTDASLEVARAYSRKDTRIRVIESNEHVGPIQNWNRSLSYISADANYIKFVHADDWIYADCLQKMIDVASADPNIGIVSAYRLEEDRISLDRLPKKYAADPQLRRLSMNGREVSRAIFREYSSVLGSPTSVLYVRNAVDTFSPFFDETFLHADKEVCLRILAMRDLGFVREILTYTRRHNESVTSRTNVLDTRRQDDLLILRKHGPAFLSETEFKAVQEHTVRLYYGFLARAVGGGKSRLFWASHRDALRRAGVNYRRWMLLKAVLRNWLDLRSALKNFFEQRSSQRHHGCGTAADEYVSGIRKAPRQSDS